MMNIPKRHITRRNFLETAALGTAALTLVGPTTVQAAPDLRQYEPNLRDRLWMWGHFVGSLDGLVDYKVPGGNRLDMADACEDMGIPNVCIVFFTGQWQPPFDEYMKQFHKTKRVAWSILYSGPRNYDQMKQDAFDLCDKMPNLVSFYLDDYFLNDAVPKDGKKVSPARLSLQQLQILHKDMAELKKKIDLSCVLYSNQLHPAIKGHIDCFDDVSFWTWNATDLVALENNFNKYREIVPDKPTRLGIYMWDFGNGKPVAKELMKLQLEFALKKYQEKQIDGMIFHCTPLVDIGLEAVEYSRKWIAEYGDLVR